ncbi:MAG: hypothetical protein ACRD3R_06720 [Terriglobales bacterium]
MRATAATLTLAMALVGTAPTLAFCQVMCFPAKAQATHHSAPAVAHHHPSDASQTHRQVAALKDSSACKSLAQVALLRTQNALGGGRQLATTAATEVVNPSQEAPASPRLAARFPDRQGPPVTASPVVPLRV